MSSNSMQERIIELMSERIAKLCGKVEWLTRERDEARSEVERQRTEIERLREAMRLEKINSDRKE